jgi:hypothetical protein
MTRTGIGCGLGKTLQQEPNARGINSREACAMTPNPRLERVVNGLGWRSASAHCYFAPASGRSTSSLGVTRITRRGAQCLLERPLALAGNCVFKSKANRVELAFATASRASKGPAVFSQHWQASLLRSKSSVLPPNTSASGIKEQGSHSGFAQSVGRPSSTPKMVTMSLWA